MCGGARRASTRPSNGTAVEKTAIFFIGTGRPVPSEAVLHPQDRRVPPVPSVTAVLTGRGDHYFQVSWIDFGRYANELGTYQHLQGSSGPVKLVEHGSQKGQWALKIQIKIR